jgi:TRAP transporter TAXI family solute receptor
MKRVVSIILAVALVVSLVGCGAKKAPASSVQTATEPKATETKTAVPQAQRISLGTASVGGIYYVYGAGLAQLLTSHVDGLVVSAEVTGGAAVNVGLVDSNEVQLGLATDNTACDGLAGVGWAKGTKYENIRAIAPMYPTFLEIYAIAGNGVETIQDFNGKVYCAGTAGSSGDVVSGTIMETLGINPKTKQYMSWTDAIGQMKDGLIDCGLDLAGSPHNARLELETSHHIKWIELSDSERAKLKDKGSYFKDGIIKAGVYKDMKEDYKTLMVYNDIIANKDLDNETVYNILTALYDNHDELVTAHSTAKDTLAKNIANVALPLHPGAIKWYEDHGITISPSQYPPEYKK